MQLKKFGATKGAWAGELGQRITSRVLSCYSQVVTGASDGIGREFSLQLAAAGFNILLVARNRDSLATLAEEIGT
jgi:17beta-estradiol 17-dehydrogenase / very-long-chain 3-oxoacyl-CoA reductase